MLLLGRPGGADLRRKRAGLRYGDKLLRSSAALTDAFNRRRSNGQQAVVRVEHAIRRGRPTRP